MAEGALARGLAWALAHSRTLWLPRRRGGGGGGGGAVLPDDLPAAVRRRFGADRTALNPGTTLTESVRLARQAEVLVRQVPEGARMSGVAPTGPSWTRTVKACTSANWTWA